MHANTYSMAPGGIASAHRLFSKCRLSWARTALARPCSSRHHATSKPTVFLGIESSCDDTAAAVVTSSGQVLGEAIASQAEVHAAWGGIVPALAQQAHQEAIDRVVDQALTASRMQLNDVDAVAVTIGPGLSLCLEVGVRKARALSRQAHLPLVPVHHMEAHALVARMAAGGPEALPFPFLCLLVSGGHNLLVLVKGVGDYMQLGTTVDDAIGEAYDKIARMLGLEMNPHGGAALERLALSGDPFKFKFAVPMKKHANCEFSYAGLKTSVRLCIEKELGAAAGKGKSAINPTSRLAGSRSSSSSSMSDHSQQQQAASGPPSSSEGATQQQQQQQQQQEEVSPAPSSRNQTEEQQQQTKADIAASFQRVATEHLVGRLKRGLSWAQEECPQLDTLVVAGGVAANQYIRQQLGQVCEGAGVRLVVPPARWCTDNGVMVAWAGYERWRLGLVQPPLAPLPDPSQPPAAQERVDLRPRWPLTGVKHRGSMPPTLSMKSASKLATSLTDVTQQELAELQQQQQGEGQREGEGQHQKREGADEEQEQQQLVGR